jgi:hypothetical protein
MVDSDDLDAPLNEDGVRVLVQEFDVPEGALPVRMQVGDAPVTIVGWVAPGDGNIGNLFREIAREVDEIEASRAAV